MYLLKIEVKDWFEKVSSEKLDRYSKEVVFEVVLDQLLNKRSNFNVALFCLHALEYNASKREMFDIVMKYLEQRVQSQKEFNPGIVSVCFTDLRSLMKDKKDAVRVSKMLYWKNIRKTSERLIQGHSMGVYEDLERKFSNIPEVKEALKDFEKYLKERNLKTPTEYSDEWAKNFVAALQAGPIGFGASFASTRENA